MSAAPREATISTDTRRAFLKRAGAAAAVATFVAVAGFDTEALAQGFEASPRVQAFRIDHPVGTSVHISTGERFDVVVRDATGTVVEEFRSITAARFMRVKSSYFEVTAINPGE